MWTWDQICHIQYMINRNLWIFCSISPSVDGSAWLNFDSGCVPDPLNHNLCRQFPLGLQRPLSAEAKTSLHAIRRRADEGEQVRRVQGSPIGPRWRCARIRRRHLWQENGFSIQPGFLWEILFDSGILKCHYYNQRRLGYFLKSS